MKQVLVTNLIFVSFTLQVLTTKVCGQNLVLNPSMEDTITCPSIVPPPPFLRSIHWFRPTSGSSDFFNIDTNCAWGGNVPNNVFGYQFPRSGSTYLGLKVISSPPLNDFREYISGTLSDSLIIGKKYCVSFYVSAPNNCKYLTDDIGAFFCNDSSSITDYNSHNPLNLIPQIENTQGNILGDTLNWMLVSGELIAQGGEKFITIGNFKSDINSTVDTIQSANYNGGYYYVDDVSVIDCTVGLNELQTGIIDIFPNPCIDEINVKFTRVINSKLNITIYNSLGIQVHSENNLADQKIKINTSKFPSGFYFIRIWTEHGNYIKRFIKLY